MLGIFLLAFFITIATIGAALMHEGLKSPSFFATFICVYLGALGLTWGAIQTYNNIDRVIYSFR